jgi:hypothetical protein
MRSKGAALEERFEAAGLRLQALQVGERAGEAANAGEAR